MKKRVLCVVSLPLTLLASLSLDASAGEFRVESASASELVTFFETGDIHVALGDIREGENAILTRNASTTEFVIENSTGNVILRIPDDTGDLHIAGTIQQQLPGPLVPPAHSFVIQNTTGQVVTYVDTSGNLSTKGRIFLHGRPVQRVKGGGHWGGHSADVDFSSFSSSPGRSVSDDFTLDRAATIQGNNLVLADTLSAQAPFSNDVVVGAAWLNEKVPLTSGFRVDFDFTITTGSTDRSAAGFGFVIQNQSALPPLHSGLSSDCGFGLNPSCAGMTGFSGITDAVAIEFDAGYFGDGFTINGIVGDTVSLHSCNPLSVVSVCNQPYLATNYPGSDFSVNDLIFELVARLKGTHHATIVYDGQKTISWRIDDFPPFQISLQGYSDIRNKVGANDAWIGFVGAASRNAGLLHRTEIHNFSIQVQRPLIIGISGERAVSVSLSGPLESSGVNALLNCLNSDEFETRFFSEERIYADGSGPVWEHFLRPRIESSTNQFRYALIGHSHGGGDVYLLSKRITEDIANGQEGDLFMTAYVDAIEGSDDANPFPETRPPFLTQHHVNLYQPSGILHGASLGSSANLDLEVNSLACAEGVGHGFIDNCVVTQRILTTHLRHEAFGETLLSPAQICAQAGSYCDANSEDYVCTP